MAGEPANRVFEVAVYALVQVLAPEIVRRSGGCIFAGENFVKVAGHGGPLAKNRPEAAQLEEVVIPGAGPPLGVQERQGCGMVLGDRLVQVVSPMEEGLRTLGRVRGSGERLDLLAVRRRPANHGHAIDGHNRFVKGQQHGLADADTVEHERQLRMGCEALARLDAYFFT